jgi:hypothetical protein
MSTVTPNFGLVKPDLADDADIRVINSNMDLLDTLISNLTNVVKRSKTYEVGDTSISTGLQAAYFLECTTAGTTGDTVPVITSPVAEGDTIADGTVTWTVRKAVCENDYSKTSFGTAVVNHLLGSTLASLVSTVSTDSLFTKLLKKALEAAGLQYNMGANGYICLGSLFGGLILQWGKHHAATTSGSISFPISFTSTNVYVFAIVKSNTSGAASGVASIYSVSKTTAIVKITRRTNMETFYWLAIGY